MSAENWIRPPIHTPEFAELSRICAKRRLVLRAANNYAEACEIGADYFIRDRFSEAVLHEADTLGELRTWLRVPELQA